MAYSRLRMRKGALQLLPDYGGDGYDLFDGIGGGIRVPTIIFSHLRGVGYPRNRGDAAGDDFGGLSPRLGGH